MTIRTRLTLWYAVAFAVTLVVVAALVAVEFAHRMRNSLAEALQVHAQDVRANLSDGEAIVDALDPTRPGIFTVLFAADGSVIRAGPGAPDGLTPPPEGPSTRPTSAAGPALAHNATRTQDARTNLVGTSMAEQDRSVQQLVELLLLFAVMGGAASLAGGWWLAGRALTPVDRLRREADAIAPWRLTERLEVEHPGDEIGRLATTLNALLGRVEASVVRERAFVAGAAHDLRTPVATLRMRLELAAALPPGDPALPASIAAAHDDAVHLSDLADGLLRLAEVESAGQADEGVPVTVADLLMDAEREATWLAQDRGVLITLDAPVDTVVVVPIRVHQAIVNLVINAVRHSPRNDRVEVHARRSREATAGGSEVDALRVEVHDRGPGIDPATTELLFMPFAASDRSAAPHGLGLVIAAAAVRSQGGDIGYQARAGGGSTFWFWVPDRGVTPAGGAPTSGGRLHLRFTRRAAT